MSVWNVKLVNKYQESFEVEAASEDEALAKAIDRNRTRLALVEKAVPIHPRLETYTVLEKKS